MSIVTSSAAAPARFDSPEQEVFLNLWRTYDRLRVFEDELFGPFGLTPQQYNLLRVLRSEHPQTVLTLELARRLVSRAPDITRMVDSLVERGWAERTRPAENRRTVRIGIAPAGLALLRKIAGPLRACHGKQLGHLSSGDLQKLCALLRAARRPHEPDDSTWR